MKANLSLLLVFFFGILSAETISNSSEDVFRDNYVRAVIHLEDGSEKDGYIREFRKEVVYSYGAMGATEKQFGLQTKTHFFKKNSESKREKIKLEDIKSIDFVLRVKSHNVQEIKTWEKVRMATINNNLKLKKDRLYTLLPVWYKDQKITVYSYLLSDYPKFFFRKNDDEFAIFQHFKLFDLFNLQKYGDRQFGIFRYIGKNCPEYLEWIDTENAKGVQAEVTWGIGYEKVAPELKEYDDSLKEDLKSYKKTMNKEDYKEYKEWRENVYNSQITNYYYRQYDPLVMEYINSCE